MGRRVPWKVTGLGLVLFVAGLNTFIAVQRWMDTRIVRPVDMPVSLVAGHIRTEPFRLNLKTSYWVTLDPGAWWSTGRACADEYSRLLTRRVLYRIYRSGSAGVSSVGPRRCFEREDCQSYGFRGGRPGFSVGTETAAAASDFGAAGGRVVRWNGVRAPRASHDAADGRVPVHSERFLGSCAQIRAGASEEAMPGLNR